MPICTRDASSKIGDAGVRMMEPTEYTYRRDSARLRMVFLVESSGDALTDALTGSGVVVVICEFGDEAMQLVAVENKHMVQTFPFTAANEALAVGVGLGGLEWCPQLLDAAAGSNGRETPAVLAVPIANEVLGRFAPGRGFAQLLGSPVIGGGAGHGSMHDPARH